MAKAVGIDLGTTNSVIAACENGQADVIPTPKIKPETRELVMGELRHHFRPEFLNRIDDIVFFSPLTQVQIEQIIELMFSELRTRLVEGRMILEISDEARRFIAREVEIRFGRALLTDVSPDGATIRVEFKVDELVVAHDDPQFTTSTAA
jgi:ATP-dependent Clp protease ATP-binding subunit ClpB